MKKIVSFFALMMLFIAVNAQAPDPVKWTYVAKKIADKTYEIHLTATIQSTWHLYSQTQPEDAINEPTEIVFMKNPLLVFDGKVKEVGKMEMFKDTRLKISANQYSNKVEFVQKVKVKGNARTNVVGSVRYQTCDDKKCLPAKKSDFSVALQ